ncbi:FAD-dependent oxidoreductase (plasmid) [Rhizobium sp. CB3090]|uniref:NAD(P)/FAD-dependent oxidoreductase n=1 Tax=Rhizobium sp. CB3090 TaxID=3039156 RepID=UPI0024B0E131|nr:FAD-dependent oxidoreductase [Rhizobium sp. CB3090]WFU11847.1 FAD-dependent oxidoreductase [Rhizobium sp. CB3090]
MAERIVIVGAGQAGLAAAAKLRQEKFEGAITLLGAEGVLPYQRPPLSKAYLLGKLEAERLSLRTSDFYQQQQIDIRPNLPALSIDRTAKTVATRDECLRYDHLILATGSRPIRLPARMTDGVDGIFYLRSKADADSLRPFLRNGVRILVVGGGYVGLEVAAASRQVGAAVTVVEMAPRILNRVAAEPTASYFRNLHRSQGVEIREGIGLTGLKAHGAAVLAALEDGSSLSIDAVVVGIGVQPDTALAREAGLEADGGIVVDGFGRTSDPSIWAAGDCATFLHDGEMTRLESVPHAIDQAEHVSRNILGAAISYRPRPWFWSDQYATKLQIAGLNRGYDRTTVTPGATEGSMTVSYLDGDRLLAVDCLNDARSFMQAKRRLGL